MRNVAVSSADTLRATAKALAAGERKSPVVAVPAVDTHEAVPTPKASSVTTPIQSRAKKDASSSDSQTRRLGGMKPFSLPPLKETDSLRISEFADLFGFPASAVLTAIERQRRQVNKPYYSIPQLAERWACSRSTVYEVLYEAEYEVLDLRRRAKQKGPKRIPGHVVEKIEKSRLRPLEAEPTEAEEAA